MFSLTFLEGYPAGELACKSQKSNNTWKTVFLNPSLDLERFHIAKKASSG